MIILSGKAKERLKRLQDIGAKIETNGFNKPSIVLWDKSENETWTWIQLDHIADYSDKEFENYYRDFVTIVEKNKNHEQA